MQKKNFVLAIDISIVLYFLFLRFGHINDLLITPLIDEQAFLALTPFSTFGPVLIQQPSSTLIVMGLALYTFLMGKDYLKHPKDDFIWFIGFNFIFWGIGAFLAGLSYQSFGYYFKCSFGPYCSFTNYIELLYMLVTVYSINAILLAYTHIISHEKTKEMLTKFALGSVIGYTIFQGIGILIPNQFLVSYEGLLLFLSPNILIFMVLSYQHRHQELHQKLLKLWTLFLMVNLVYFIALFAGIGTYLYQTFNLWFNENDVLHIALLLWMIIFKKEINPKL